MDKYDIEDRLIKFAVLIIEIVETLPDTKAGNHMGGQLLHSGTSPALNYGEAQSGESIKDFIHKIKIVLKELRETLVCLKVIHLAKLFKTEEKILLALNECDQLISIFVRSVKTVQKNNLKQNA
jgi:four helix bundle protein